MIRTERDPYRWRRRWAWRPRKIGEQWIWFEWYARRPLKTAEVAALLSDLYTIGPLRPSFWEEFTIKKTGYTLWRESVFSIAMGPPMRFWHTPRYRLRVVS